MLGGAESTTRLRLFDRNRRYHESPLSRQPNDRLGEAEIVILRLLFRHGELSVSAMSGLLGLYQDRVAQCCEELLNRGLISLRTVTVEGSEFPVAQLEPKGRTYLVDKGHT